MMLACIVWGLSFVVVKDSLDYFTPMWQLALRLMVAAGPALVIALMNLKKWNWATVKKCVILGVIFFLAIFVQNFGMNYVSASKSAFLTGTYVAFVPLIEILILRKKLKLKKILAAAVCLMGTGFLTLRGTLVPESGDLLLIFCGFWYAVHLLYIDQCEEISPVLLHMGQILVAFVLALMGALLLEPVPTSFTFHSMSGLVYCGIFEILLGFFFQLVGQKNTSATLSGILLSMESIFAALFAILFLHEIMSWTMIVGSMFIIAAAIINGIKETVT